MKSKLIEQKSNQVKYPRLFKYSESNLTVLFTAPKEGVVVVGDSGYDIGHYSDDLLETHRTIKWQELPKGSKVILEQE